MKMMEAHKMRKLKYHPKEANLLKLPRKHIFDSREFNGSEEERKKIKEVIVSELLMNFDRHWVVYLLIYPIILLFWF